MISKTISAFNESIYVLFFLVFTAAYLHYHSMVLGLFFLVLLFRFRKRPVLLVFIIFANLLFVFLYLTEYSRIETAVFPKNITCKVASFPVYKNEEYHFYCNAAEGRLLVYLKTDTAPESGDYITIQNHLEKVKNNTVPGLFNYARYLLSKGIAYKTVNDEFTVENRNKAWNDRLISFFNKRYGGLINSQYILSFIIGNKNALTDDFTEQIKALNISHLFVVSGFHIGFLYLLFRTVFKYLRFSKERSEILILFLLCLFLVMNNFSVSVLRAVLFLIFYKLKSRFNLPVANVNLLSMVALINLYLNPFVFYDAGFILSYLITFALFLGHQLLKEKNYLKKAAKLNLLAQAVSFPVVASFAYDYNFLSLLTTPLLSLYYTFVIFPLTVILLIFPFLDSALTFFFQFYETILAGLSNLSLFKLNVGNFTLIRYLLYYTVLLSLFMAWEGGKKARARIALILIISLFYHRFVLIDEVTYFDVGQGDSIFIRSRTEACTALIDTGGVENGKIHPAQNVVSYLKATQTSKIDFLFFSHTDFDHAGDYRLILDNFKVKSIVFSPYDESDLHDEIEAYAKSKKMNIMYLDAYNNVECGNINFKNINPGAENNTINDNSLVLFLIFNGNNYLFPGDISAETEEKLIKNFHDRVDFVKIAHHGSSGSASAKFLEALDPELAVISVGINFYGHPSKETLKLLDEEKIPYYRTDLDGSVSVKYYLGRYRMIKTFCPYNNDA